MEFRDVMMLRSSSRPHMACVGRTVYCHTSTGKASNPSKAHSLFQQRKQRWRQRGVALFSWSSCSSSWKVFFWWNQWKQGMLKGVAATNSLWVGKYARTGAHLSQNRRHCSPLLLIFYPSASFSFVCLLQSLISGQSTSLFLSAALSFLFVALFFPSPFVC